MNDYLMFAGFKLAPFGFVRSVPRFTFPQCGAGGICLHFGEREYVNYEHLVSAVGWRGVLRGAVPVLVEWVEYCFNDASGWAEPLHLLLMRSR